LSTFTRRKNDWLINVTKSKFQGTIQNIHALTHTHLRAILGSHRQITLAESVDL
jgi:hypothetical protein